MELDAKDSDLDGLSADVCVVGAGPVGLALAEALASRGAEAVVLESGGREAEEDAGELNEGDVEGGYGDLRVSRARGVGGTARLWNTVLQDRVTAKYVPLDPLDFEPRSWIPHSGWPIGAEELEPYRVMAERTCGLVAVTRGVAPDGSGYPLLDLEGGGLTTGVYQFGPASRFTRELPHALARSDRAVLVRGATVTGMVPGATRTSVSGVRFRTRSGGVGSVLASHVVIAAGGIESARLLLLAREESLPTVRDDWLGVGFMEHPIDSTLELSTSDAALAPPGGFYSQHGVGRHSTVVGRIALEPELLRANRLPNASIRLREEGPALLEAPGVAAVGRRIIPFPRARRIVRGALERAARSAARLGRTRYRLLVDLEQAPSRENRVTLSNRRDSLGQRRARLVWSWSAEDDARRAHLLSVITRELERAGLGRVRRSRDGTLNPLAHHHLGTTRMHKDAAQGVVDEHLRVHGVDNLHVVGSSVFPTGGFANPTLTAIALALRLAERLKPGA